MKIFDKYEKLLLRDEDLKLDGQPENTVSVAQTATSTKPWQLQGCRKSKLKLLFLFVKDKVTLKKTQKKQICYKAPDNLMKIQFEKVQ